VARSRWTAAGAVGGGDPTVEGGGDLPDDERALLPDAGQPRRERAGLGVGLLDTHDEVDPSRPEPVGTTDGELGRLGDGDDDAGDPGGEERVGARAGAAGVRAGLQGDDGGAASGPLTGLAEGGDLRVGPAGRRGGALSHRHSRRVEDHRADRRVRARRPQDGLAELPRPGHRPPLGLADAHPGIAADAWARSAAIAVAGSSAP
jgi:hypothetical protein